MRKQGFTLVELLVVVAIMALLIAILLPALNKARDAAKAAVCLSNQHQCAVAFHEYAADNQGRIITSGIGPTGTGGGTEKYWGQYLGGFNAAGEKTGGFYLNRRVAVCPASPSYARMPVWMSVRKPTGFNWSDAGDDSKTYAVNNPTGGSYPALFVTPGWIWIKPDSPSGSGVGIRVQDLTRLIGNSGSNAYGGAAQTVLLVDSGQYVSGSFVAGATYTANSLFDVNGRRIHIAHGGRANAVFYDGHAASMTDDNLRHDTASHIMLFFDESGGAYLLP